MLTLEKSHWLSGDQVTLKGQRLEVHNRLRVHSSDSLTAWTRAQGPDSRYEDCGHPARAGGQRTAWLMATTRGGDHGDPASRSAQGPPPPTAFLWSSSCSMGTA